MHFISIRENTISELKMIVNNLNHTINLLYSNIHNIQYTLVLTNFIIKILAIQ